MPHTTEGAFPNDGVFSRLLELCKERDGIIIDDPTIGVQATYHQLLTDVEQMRLKLARILKEQDQSIESLIEQNYHIGYVGHANYEYAVASFATLALGGVMIPLPLTIEEQSYARVSEKCDLRCILAGRDYKHQAAAFQKCANSSLSSPIDVLSIIFNTSQNSPTSFGIDESFQIPDTRPAWVYWTSGSTGMPKGAIHDRRLFTTLPKQFDQVTIAHRPAFYIAGTWAIIQSVFVGRHVSVLRMNPGPDVLWERIRQGGVTTVTATVAFYDALARYFRSHLETSPLRNEYLESLSSFKMGFIGGSMPVPSLLKYWRDVLGAPLSIAWGSTEIGGVLTTADPEASINLERCIGKLRSSTHTIKLSEGDHGTVLVEGNSTFKGYLHNQPPYHELVDNEGSFITGDTAHRDGDYYIFDGRTSSDFIKAVGGPVPVVYMENTISKLPYIEEVYVLPVMDKTVGSRVGVLARCSGSELTLRRLREDLVKIVPAFMLPTALRTLRTGEEIERNHSEKIARILTVEKFFGVHSGAELWDLRF
ncbi:acetyl-CoA synthetase-like protein [Aspergillus affinis]|uniref:acetyl-CoA synthetase-like protein n=1 Tax=Aspergillus affinis TaxID=1070780 RepID=UPI0022FE512D|nr:acetyl-CoA synthetase-like protein [Aspergillus affinis]KAI9038869.1 acetyl-CoA synthetase-like protein [Aspergillus affinis]